MRDHTKLRAFELADEVVVLIYAEYVRFLEIAFGSLRELHYQFGLSKRLGYSDEHGISDCDSKIVETEKVSGCLDSVNAQALTAFPPTV